jgi:hypothetical protein
MPVEFVGLVGGEFTGGNLDAIGLGGFFEFVGQALTVGPCGRQSRQIFHLEGFAAKAAMRVPDWLSVLPMRKTPG